MILDREGERLLKKIHERDYVVALAIDGTTLPASTMSVTPAAVNEFFNVSRAINASVFRGCCQTVTIRNISDQPILVEDANVIISRPDLR